MPLNKETKPNGGSIQQWQKEKPANSGKYQNQTEMKEKNTPKEQNFHWLPYSSHTSLFF